MPNNIYTIPADSPFTDTLAQWVLEKCDATPTGLSRVLMLLPTRRACIALRDAFLRASGGKALLLPRLQPIGDVDEGMLLATRNLDLAPPSAEQFDFKRLFIIAQLIQRHNHSRMDHALRLAQELARLFDELEREQVALKDLIRLVPEDFASHWQITVEFLKIISEYWPQIAKEENMVSGASYRNQILVALAKSWRDAPPEHPVIVAGTTGSIPASADVIASVAAMPQGMIVLPGFDTQAGEAYLENITESHPQWGMHTLLRRLKVDEAQEIRCRLPVAGCKERVKLLSEIMRPAEMLEGWQALDMDMPKALQGMKRIICTDIQEEAGVIALMLRETLEHPGKTAALVTHDRALARRVCAIMKRFGVTLDDSAGQPLLQTPIAVFLRLVAEVAASGMDAVKLVSLLKHPLARSGMERIACLEAAREYELLVLRKSVAGCKLQVASGVSDGVKQLMQNIEKAFSPFIANLQSATCNLQPLVAAHLQCAEALAGDGLWDGPEAETISKLLAEIQLATCNLQPATPSYPEIFDTLLAGQVFRPEYGNHPRLKILGAMEARMQSCDRIILGGLNEGSWPPDITADPWLNRPMRAGIGLPAPERSIGLAAHDFFMLASAPEVYLTRAEKTGGTKTTPSRWLLKLDVLLAKFFAQSLIEDNAWCERVRLLDFPAKVVPVAAPVPKPPLAARPMTISVTQVETWLRNPYALYAALILDLYPLDPMMRELNGADFGTSAHKALEAFVRAYPSVLPDKPYETLLQYGQEALQALLQNDRVRALWWPRFVQIAEFILQCERGRRPAIQQIATEVDGKCAFGNFTLKGRADRIEEYKDGILAIIDYKTGALPTTMDIENGLASQLLLLAVIMQELQQGARRCGEGIADDPAGEVSRSESGGSVPPIKIASLEYWQLQGGGRGRED